MRLSYIAVCLTFAAMLASCSTINKFAGTKPRKTIKTEAVKPDNKEVQDTRIDLGVMGVKPSPEELGGAQWVISSVGDHNIVAEDDAPYINFQPSTGRFYASDGCNIINGDYVLRSDGVIYFSNTASTRMYCPNLEYAAAISELLSDKSSLSADWRRIGHESYLMLRDTRGVVKMTLRRHNMEFMNGNWRVASIDGKSVNDDECNIFFDIAELKLHGNTGCNYFNGDIYIDPSRSNAIDFSNMGVTRMSCPNTSRETAMLVALEQTVSAISGKDGESVLLLDLKGKELMILKRLPMPEKDGKQ